MTLGGYSKVGRKRVLPDPHVLWLCGPRAALHFIKGSLGGETSVLRTFRMSGKELVKERVSEGKS